MIYNISGEQPFQVLNDSFSVSPSQSGYDLYLSADGVNYARFASVAADTTRQFTGMNEGNYYKLMGNTSDVKVNWMKDCSGGGGGGAAGVSSIDGQTGALTTKTIGGQSILGSGDIETGGGNYVIVDALSAITNPVEGMLAFVPAHSEENTYPFMKLQINSDVELEGPLGWFRRVEDWTQIVEVYQSGSGFHRGNWGRGNGGDYIFRPDSWTDGYDGVERTLNVIWRSYIDFENGHNCWIEISTATTTDDCFFFDVRQDFAHTALTSETVTTYFDEHFYRYENGSWNEMFMPSIFDFDNSTKAERAALFSYIASKELSDVNEKMTFFKEFDNYYQAKGKVRLQYAHYYANEMCFTATLGHIYGEALVSPTIRLFADGGMEIHMYEYAREPEGIYLFGKYLEIDNGTYSGFTFDFQNATNYEALNWFIPGEGWLLQVRRGDGRLANLREQEYTDDDKLHYVIERVYNHYLEYYYRRSGYTITFLFRRNGPADVSDFQYLDPNVTYTAVTETISYVGIDRLDGGGMVDNFRLNTGDTITCGEDTLGAGAERLVRYVQGEEDGNNQTKYVALLNLRYNTGTSWLDEKRYTRPMVSLEPSDFSITSPCGADKYFRYKVYLDYGDIVVSFYIQTEEGHYCRFTITDGANVVSPTINNIITLTQAEYDAITPAADAMYFITD